MGNMVFAENESLTVLDVESFNAGIGEAVSYSLTRYSQSGVEEIDEYEAICDAQGIVIDKVNKTITSEKPGIYDITFSAKDGFSEKIKLAVNDNKKEQISGKAVFSEDFEGELPDVFKSLSKTVIKEDANGNGYMFVDAKGNIINTPLFGTELTDYVFEADIETMGCDASSTSQISVGMRAQSDLSAYRFAHHDVVKYPGSGHSAGSGNVIKYAYSMSRSTSNPLLTAWYYDFIKKGDDSVYNSSKRGFVKPYHFTVSIIGDTMTAVMTDIESGEEIESFEAKTSAMDNSQASLSKGYTTLSFHSMAAGYDNISIKPIVSLDKIELITDKDVISGKSGDDFVTYSVKLFEDGVEKDSEADAVIVCEGAVVDNENKTITFPKQGEYYIGASFGNKYSVKKIKVSENSGISDGMELAIPEVVYDDFEVTIPDNLKVIISSSNPEVLDFSGNTATVTRPKADETDAEVAVTVVIMAGTSYEIKRYNTTVKKLMTDKEAVEYAMSLVDIPKEVTENINLPTEFPDGVTGVWKSNDTGIISDGGAVIRGEVDKRVKLTLTLKGEGAEKVVEYYVKVKGTSGKSGVTVTVGTEKLNYDSGSVVPVDIRVFDNLGEITDYSEVIIETDNNKLVADSEKRTVTSEYEGAFGFKVKIPEYGFEKELMVSFVDKNNLAATDIKELYSEDFESDDYDEAFKNNSDLTVSDGKLNLKGVSRNYQTKPFGPKDEDGNLINLLEYIFEADIKMNTCDAGNTGQMSVGVRYNEENDASYRAVHHERIKYDEKEGAINTQSAESMSRILALSYGKSSAAASWYISKIGKSPDTMFSGRGYSKEYHWRVIVTKSSMSVEISDIATGEVVQKMSAPLSDLYLKRNGAKLAELGAGTTVLGTWSTDFAVDNIKIGTMTAFDSLDIEIDEEVTDSVGKETAIRVYSRMGDERKLLTKDDVTLSCESSDITFTDNGVIANAEGEYFIKAEKAGKSVIKRFVVSKKQKELNEIVNSLSLDNDTSYVINDFTLPTAEKGEIKWICSDEKHTETDGKTLFVTRPEIGEADVKTVLSAVVTLNGETLIKTFELTIPAKITDEAAVENAKALIKIPEEVTEDITLPTECGDGVTISWSSSESKVISEKGEVRRGDDDESVTLTAWLSRNNTKETMKFKVTVKGTGNGGGQGSSGSSSGGGGGSGSSFKTPVIEAEFPATYQDSIFSDLSGYAWAENAILKLYEKGIVSGYEDGSFKPQKEVTREEFASMIARCIGIESNAEQCFSDVDKDSWYAGYIAALAHAGIISGLPDGSFGVGRNITRQDMAVIVTKAMGYSEKEAEEFNDHESISEYAKSSVYALKGAEIVVGSDGYFKPLDNLTRAEAAVVIAKIAG